MKIKTASFAIFFLISLTSISYAMTTKVESNNSSKKQIDDKKGFRFEDYKTAEEAREALLEMYPVGSNSEDLVNYLKKLEFYCFVRDGSYVAMNEMSINQKKELIKNSHHDSKKVKIADGTVFCGAKFPKNYPISTEWNISIEKNKENKITKIHVDEKYFGL